MAIAEHAKADGRLAIVDARRSTRIPWSVRLSVSGQTALGSKVSDLTSTLMVNCHGCVYSSRYEYPAGSWVTLEMPHSQVKGVPRPLRAQVRFTRLPRNPKELYQIGVELETPANVWGIDSPPQDWSRFPTSDLSRNNSGPLDSLNGAFLLDEDSQPALVTPDSSSAPPSGTAWPARQTVTAGANALDRAKETGSEVVPEHVLRVLEAKLQQAADKAAASAVAARLNTTVNQAVMAIDNFSRASVRQVENDCTLIREKLVSAAREELLSKVQADFAEAQERLRTQLEVPLQEAKEVAENLQKNVSTEIHLALAEAVDCLKTKSAEMQNEFGTRLTETSDKAAAELGAETVRFSDRQLTRVANEVGAATREAMTVLETRVIDASTQLETVIGAALAACQQRTNAELQQTTSSVLQRFEETLHGIGAQIRSDVEESQRAHQAELGRLSEQHGSEFRRQLDSMSNTSLRAGLSAVNEKSKLLLESLLKDSSEPVGGTNP